MSYYESQQKYLDSLTPEQKVKQFLRHMQPQDYLDAAYYWKGSHRGIPYQIVLWDVASAMHDGKGSWNYYLFLKEQAFADQSIFERMWLDPVEYPGTERYKAMKFYQYSGVYPLTLFDMNGGPTFYEKITDELTGNRTVKVGCDYSHHWDEERGYPYDRQYIEGSARRDIDNLHEAVVLNIRCNWDGEWYPQSEMFELHNKHYWQGNKEKMPATWFKTEENSHVING